MNISIVIAVLDSHEALDRHMKFFAAMPLPEGVEIVIVDDGSEHPLGPFVASLQRKPPRVRVLRQDVKGEWTQPAARNFGVREARGEFLILTDIDHIITKPLIEAVGEGKWDCMMFKREVAILNENGTFVQTKEAVLEYGYQKKRYRDAGFQLCKHVNSFGIRKELYLRAGGVSEKLVGTGEYPNREEKHLRHKLRAWGDRGEIKYCPEEEWPTLYMFPNGKYAGDVDHNPFGLFHNLSRKTPQNRQWRWQQQGRFTDV